MTQEIQSPYVNLGKAFQLCVGYLIMFIAISCTINMSSQVMMDDGFGNLGFYTVGLVYLMGGVTGFFAPSIVNRLGNKVCLVIAGAFNCMWLISNIFAAIKHEYPDLDSVIVRAPFVYTVGIIASLINGFGVTVMNVAQGNYVSLCATEETKGLYFSLFWMFYMGA